MPLEALDVLAVGDTVDLHEAVGCPRGKELPVARKLERRDGVGVRRGKLPDDRPVGDVPELDLAGAAGAATAGGEGLTVGGEGERRDAVDRRHARLIVACRRRQFPADRTGERPPRGHLPDPGRGRTAADEGPAVVEERHQSL